MSQVQVFTYKYIIKYNYKYVISLNGIRYISDIKFMMRDVIITKAKNDLWPI